MNILKNKKGLTLIEIIVAIALLSIVSIFMYNLIISVSMQVSNPVFSVSNQVNRMEIIKIIEEDIINRKISNISKVGQTITFTDGETINTSSLLWDENYITYVDFSNHKYKWQMDSSTIDLNNVTLVNQNGVYTITIKIYNTNSDNKDISHNNVQDDIVLTYYDFND